MVNTIIIGFTDSCNSTKFQTNSHYSYQLLLLLGLVCYDTLQTAGFGKKVEKICPPMSKCVLIEAKALMPSVAGSAGKATQLKCK